MTFLMQLQNKNKISEFEHAFKNLVSRLPSATPNYLEKIIMESYVAKARLSHYFPTQSKDDKEIGIVKRFLIIE
ncbi:hypothetical protein F8M41_003045 [Gigaspora margarita]|uniref:Uncharacterized protein n=1 Tax=Gigaspora margarita TaxID=4874 RepID=A0A8H3XBW6_GIGMA|nr:hypothetical protein F8M41_003045 [Gigaspora margarita]